MVFSTVLYQSKFNIFNYELINEVRIVFFPCLYIKVRKSKCFTNIIHSSIPYFSDLCHNCQHQLSGLHANKIKNYVII